MEHSVLVFAQFVVAIDRLFQKRLRTALPQVDDLVQDPARLLADNEITIGPMKRRAMALILGSGLGFCVCCGFSGYRVDHAGHGPPPGWELLSVVAGMIIVAGCSATVLERLLRGGQLTLRLQGVVCRHRANCVFVPWSAISVHAPFVVQENVAIFPTGGIAVNSLVHSRNGIVVSTGPKVWTKPVAVRKDGRVILENLYAVRLNEVCELLGKLGYKLGQFSPPRSFEPGEPVPEEMT